ncbi:hypothetical protein GCM10010455_18220 [Microbacterium esteraromaticum]
MRRSTAALAGSLMILLALVGCASEDLDWDMTPADAVGLWKVVEPGGDGKLRLNSDGTFSATDWPKDLCAPAVSTLDQLDPATKVSFSGEYGFMDGAPYSAYLLPGDRSCEGITFYFWKGPDSQRRIQVDLIPADGSEPTEFVRLEPAKE